MICIYATKRTLTHQCALPFRRCGSLRSAPVMCPPTPESPPPLLPQTEHSLMSFRVTHSPSIRTNLGQPRATQNAVPLGGGTGLSMGSVFEILL